MPSPTFRTKSFYQTPNPIAESISVKGSTKSALSCPRMGDEQVIFVADFRVSVVGVLGRSAVGATLPALLALTVEPITAVLVVALFAVLNQVEG